MAIDSFKDLTVWQKAMNLIPQVYAIAAKLPAYERFALADQLRRAAVSIPSNVAEGSKRGSRADFRQFCKIALGSAAEIETQLLVVKSLYPKVVVSEAMQLIIEIQKMLTKLNQQLSKNL